MGRLGNADPVAQRGNGARHALGTLFLNDVRIGWDADIENWPNERQYIPPSAFKRAVR